MPLLAQTEADFRTIYDAYNRALAAESTTHSWHVLTEEQVIHVRDMPPAQRPMFFGTTSRIPVSYEVEYVRTYPDHKATMLIVGTFAASSGREKAEMTLRFALEKGFWRMERPIYGSNPAERAKPADLVDGLARGLRRLRRH